MNRTVKEATEKAFYHETAESLAAYLQVFITADNFAKHPKALRWRTSFQAVGDAWAKDPSAFKVNPHHPSPEPQSW